LPIPPAETATFPIHSVADLRERWRALMGPLGFGERLLRFVFIGPDRRMIKVLGEFPIAARAEPAPIRNLMSALSELAHQAGEGGTVALLLTRPGIGPISESDRQWSTVLTRVAGEFTVPLEPIFRANDEALLLVEPA
jgi:hypothetical protein